MNSNYDKIHAKIRQIPHGKVSTYGQIAEMVGLPRHARLVGYALRNTPDDIDIPWHRVINAKGESSFPADSQQYNLQKKLLINEGVVIVGGKISLQQFGWNVTLDELLWKL
jgi:methylated-DNA-protein-cysteine methyltransferase-like protein